MKSILKTICLSLVFLLCVKSTVAGIWYVDDYLAINEGDVYDGEVFGIESGIIDVFGGDVGKIEAQNNSTVNIYEGNVDWLDAKFASTINLYGGTIGESALGVYDNASVNLFAYGVTFHPEAEAGESWISGYYIQNDVYFQIPVWDSSHFERINIVPEPMTLTLLIGGMLIIRKRNLI